MIRLRQTFAALTASSGLLLVVSLFLLSPVPVTGQDPGRQGRGGGRGGDPFAGQPRVNALVVSGGCCHDWLTQGRALMEAINKSLPVDWTVAYQGDRGTRSRFPVYNSPDWAKGFDIVVHNECSADVDDPEFIRRITAPHRAGTPAIVIHCAMHSYRALKTDEWREFLGVTTVRHTAQHNIAVKWAADEPVARGLQEAWSTPMDELYVIDKFWPGAKAVGTAISPEDKKEYPLAWTHQYQAGRVFGTTLGHGNPTWADPVFQELLVRGFRWALKKELQ